MLAVLLLIVANGLFVMGEFALMAVDRSRLERLAEEGDRGARRLLTAIRRLSFELSGAQLGITLTSVVLGFVAEPAIAEVTVPLLNLLPGVEVEEGSAASVVAALSLVTVVQMVVAELAPKSLAIARPLGSGRVSVPPLMLFSRFFRPLISPLNALANAVVRLMGVEPRDELNAVHSLAEIDLLIRASAAEGALEAESLPLLARAISFSDKTAGHALVPRVNVVSLPVDATVETLVRTSQESGHSRFPVHSGDVDDVIGLVHVKDVAGVERAAWTATTVEALLHDVAVVPESRDLASLLTEMTAAGHQLVVVADEYGGTAGIITIEDILEEIVGEIEDEYDQAAFRHVQGAGGHVVSALLNLDDVAEQVGLRLPDGDYDTLAGFVLSRLGHIPAPGDAVAHEGWELRVLTMDGRRIDRVRITPPAEPAR